MITAPETIDQSGLKQLLRERLADPGMFIDKPLVIWRSYAFDGVNDFLSREVFREYNKCHSREDRKGFMVNPKIAKKGMLGICFIDTSEDYSRSIATYGDLPVVVYAFVDSPDETVLKDFPNAEQYVFAPDFQQWAEDTRQYNNSRFIADFIRSSCEKDNVNYRWYNYFENSDISHRKGCDFPSKWLDGLSKLRMYLKIARLKKLSEVNEESFITWFRPYISPDLVAEFRNYIRDHQI